MGGALPLQPTKIPADVDCQVPHVAGCGQGIAEIGGTPAELGRGPAGQFWAGDVERWNPPAGTSSEVELEDFPRDGAGGLVRGMVVWVEW